MTVNNWIRHIIPVSYEAGRLTASVPSEFFRSWIIEHYKEDLEMTCRKALNDFAELVLVIRETQESESPNEKSNSTICTPPPPNPPKPRTWLIDCFVVGAENRMAHAAAKSITENLGKRAQWPIVYIYGDCGIGKTHLFKDIAEKAAIERCKCTLLSAETLVNELLAAIGNKATESFVHYAC